MNFFPILIPKLELKSSLTFIGIKLWIFILRVPPIGFKTVDNVFNLSFLLPVKKVRVKKKS